MGTAIVAEEKMNIGNIVELTEKWMKDAGLNVSTHPHGSSIIVLGRDHDNDKVMLAYKIRGDGVVKGPNPEKYKNGSRAYEAVVLDIRNLLSSEGLSAYDPQKRTYYNPKKLTQANNNKTPYSFSLSKIS